MAGETEKSRTHISSAEHGKNILVGCGGLGSQCATLPRRAKFSSQVRWQSTCLSYPQRRQPCIWGRKALGNVQRDALSRSCSYNKKHGQNHRPRRTPRQPLQCHVHSPLKPCLATLQFALEHINYPPVRLAVWQEVLNFATAAAMVCCQLTFDDLVHEMRLCLLVWVNLVEHTSGILQILYEHTRPLSSELWCARPFLQDLHNLSPQDVDVFGRPAASKVGYSNWRSNNTPSRALQLLSIHSRLQLGLQHHFVLLQTLLVADAISHGKDR
mmetsp:Transcript_18693/g.33782  ORF Transcript_18693/g.33782 Transcript_18693/m.33782 type:complete len:270 (-) Transcript_18693:762-1571(-)